MNKDNKKKTEKQVAKVFNRRSKILKSLGIPKRIPKQKHFMI